MAAATSTPRNSGLVERLWQPDGVTILFQPIVHICGGDRHLHAVECLTRGPRGTHLEFATALFETVRQEGVEVEVDRLCTGAALATAERLPDWLRISVNVHASTLSRDGGFARGLALHAASAGIAPSRVTVEIVETSAPECEKRFARALADLRGIGFRLAIDDIGLGHSNLKMFVDVRPDYFKIDRYFVSGVERDPYRHAVLTSVGELGRRVGALVVAEGVEADSTLNAVIDARICLVQGHLLAKPLGIDELLRHPLLAAQPPSGPKARL